MSVLQRRAAMVLVVVGRWRGKRRAFCGGKVLTLKSTEQGEIMQDYVENLTMQNSDADFGNNT